MNASKTILVYSNDRALIDTVRSIAGILNCRIWIAYPHKNGTLNPDVAAFGHFARVFDADTFLSVADELHEWIEDGVVSEGPTIVIGEIQYSGPLAVELFSTADDPAVTVRLFQALEMWRIETGLDAGYDGALARYGGLADAVASHQPILPLPLLIKASEQYRRSRPRIMVFGLESTGCTPIMPQQTRDWFHSRGHGFPADIARLDAVSNYPDYAQARIATQSRMTAEWITRLQGTRAHDAPVDNQSIEPLWNDLIKIQIATGSPIDEASVAEISRSLISLELAVLQPDVVLFMVDPLEESAITRSVSGAGLHDIPDTPSHLVRQVAGGGLPNASFRLCRESVLESEDTRSAVLSNLLRSDRGINVP
ncbi:MAG: hypothetical protein PF508_14035 [Spirochaeta sp.]|jgi:hypothetical protein|nr:hypothetical protein [Spirochaeta sp.]